MLCLGRGPNDRFIIGHEFTIKILNINPQSGTVKIEIITNSNKSTKKVLLSQKRFNLTKDIILTISRKPHRRSSANIGVIAPRSVKISRL